MKPLLYVIRRTIINALKELRRKPAIMALYIVLAIIFLLFIFSSALTNTERVRVGSTEVYGLILTSILMLIFYSSINRSIKSGSSFFRMADVNLAFTAPLSPKKVLLYGFLKQIGVTLFYVFFLVWQIPNLRNLYSIDGRGVFILLGGYFFLMFLLQVIGLLIYSWTSRAGQYRKLAERICNGLLLIFGLIILAKLVELQDLLAASKAIFNSHSFELIPLIGWFKVVLMAPVIGISSNFYLCVALIIGFTAVVCLVFYTQKTDYYEDVLANTEHKETLYAAKRAGKRPSIASMNGIKTRKVKQSYGGKGASAIFYRHLLEYKKSGFFLLSRSTLILAIGGFAAQYFLQEKGLTILLLLSIYYLFIMLFQGKWLQEMERPFIYMIPASSSAKLFYATLAELIKNFVDGLVLFVVAGAFLHSHPVVILLCAIGFTTYGLFFTYSDVLLRRLLGPIHGKVLKGIISMLMILFMLAPGIIVAMVLRFVVFDGGTGLMAESMFCLVIIGYNMILVSGIFAWAKGIFDRVELK
ncbi:MAG: putative ABC exporter domain-containing protein [Gorillibacterium sp.]|nr:putative ABC exporter domain-containing protein [Gorillibacterium sp.]